MLTWQLFFFWVFMLKNDNCSSELLEVWESESLKFRLIDKVWSNNCDHHFKIIQYSCQSKLFEFFSFKFGFFVILSNIFNDWNNQWSNSTTLNLSYLQLCFLLHAGTKINIEIHILNAYSLQSWPGRTMRMFICLCHGIVDRYTFESYWLPTTICLSAHCYDTSIPWLWCRRP